MNAIRHSNPFPARRSPLVSYQRVTRLLAVTLVLFSASVLAQQSTYIPKNKKELEREKEQIQKERKKIFSSGIYSVTTTKYPYKFGRPEKKGIIESIARYNPNGEKIEEVTYSLIDGTVRARTTYRYDSKGNVLEELLHKADNTFKTVHRYNTSGKKIETVHYKADGSVDKKITSVYDDHNLLLETIGYLEDGRIYQRDSYFYDLDGNVTEFRNNLNKFLYFYDSHGNIAIIEKYIRYFQIVDSVHYVLADRYLFDHDRSDNLVGMTHQKSDNTVKSRFRYTVNSKGQIIEEKEFNTDGRLMYSRKTSYNKNGNVVEETGVDVGRKFRHTYRYDSRGNKIEWVTYDQVNEPQVSTKYTYNRYSSAHTAAANAPPADTASYSTLDDATTEEFYQLLGGRIVAPDGGYLGMIIADTLDPQSIANAWGQYGYDESPTSIFNPSIPYGGTDGVFSPFNPNSPSPPSIYKEGKFFSYLTENENFRPRSSPKKLMVFLKSAVLSPAK